MEWHQATTRKKRPKLLTRATGGTAASTHDYDLGCWVWGQKVYVVMEAVVERLYRGNVKTWKEGKYSTGAGVLYLYGTPFIA